jgi:hypothetical protein
MDGTILLAIVIIIIIAHSLLSIDPHARPLS